MSAARWLRPRTRLGRAALGTYAALVLWCVAGTAWDEFTVDGIDASFAGVPGLLLTWPTSLVTIGLEPFLRALASPALAVLSPAPADLAGRAVGAAGYAVGIGTSAMVNVAAVTWCVRRLGQAVLGGPRPGHGRRRSGDAS